MKHLTTFRLIDEIVRTGSIRSAAERAAITASAVQRRVQSYEDELGYAIFERGPKGVRLNAAGELVIQHIRETLAETDRLQSRIADLSGLRRGHVRIGCSQALVSYFLPEQIAAYQAAHPGVSFAVDVLEHGAVPAALETYSIDLALAFDRSRPPTYKILAGVPQRLSAIMAAGHPLTRFETVRLRQCLAFPILLPSRGFGGRALIDMALAGKTFAAAPAIESNSFELLKAQVAMTEAITFQIEIGAPSRAPAQRGIVSRPLDRRDVDGGMLWLGQWHDRSLSVAGSRFAEQIIKTLSERFDLR